MEFLRILLSDKQGNSNFIQQLPLTVLVFLGLALFWSGVTFEQPPRIDLIVLKAHQLSGTDLVLLAVSIFAVNILLLPVQNYVVLLLEGKWPTRVGRRLASFVIHRQRARLNKILSTAVGREEVPLVPLDGPAEASRDDRYADGGAAEWQWRRQLAREQFARYPIEDRLLPTTLGNILRAAEDEAGQRYGLDTVTMWPRIFPFVSDRLLTMLEDLRAALDNAARFTAALLLGGVVSLVVLAPHKLWLLVPGLLFVFAWIEYRSAVSAAMAYGDTLYVVFDLYRFDVIKALHYPLPANTEEEHEINLLLSETLTKRRWVKHLRMEYAHNPESYGRFTLLRRRRRRLEY